jgi:hypothetical protein
VSKYPAPIRATIEAETKNATIKKVTVDAAPVAVRDALKPYAKALRLEKVTQNGRTTDEASAQAKNGKQSSLELDANGKPV